MASNVLSARTFAFPLLKYLRNCANVKNIDRNYATRFAAYKTCLDQFNMLIGQFTAVVSPTNGSFNPGRLGSYISTYENEEKYLKIIGGEGLS